MEKLHYSTLRVFGPKIFKKEFRLGFGYNILIFDSVLVFESDLILQFQSLVIIYYRYILCLSNDNSRSLNIHHSPVSYRDDNLSDNL